LNMVLSQGKCCRRQVKGWVCDKRKAASSNSITRSSAASWAISRLRKAAIPS